MRVAGVSVAVFVLASCGAPSPQMRFEALETRLLAADSVSIAFDVTAEGAVTAAIDGTLDLAADGSITLRAEGEFAGEPAVLALATDGDRYTYGNTTRRTLAIRPTDLRRALLIGFTRMGLLHNLAQLNEEAPPDHADGGVAEWVTVDEFEAVRLPQPGIAFAISVAGEPAGTASLDLDADGLPLARRQAVLFPTGEMHVTETYSNVTIEP